MVKQFKRNLLIGVCGILCLFLLVACNTKNTTAHSHSWIENYVEDGDRHYQECSECSERLYDEHDYVNGYCVCGKSYQDQIQHSHSWTESYVDDGDRHYQECSECYERLYGDHYYAGGYCVCGKADQDEQGLIYSKGLGGYEVIAYDGDNTDIEIPKTYKNELVVAIESNAFSNCYKLSSITIPDSIGVIGAEAFYGCFGLKAVYITDVALWCSINFETITSNPLYYAHNLCVDGRLVTKIVIPNEVCNITAYAFAGYDKLTDITISSSVIAIGEEAFNGCYGIKAVHITDLKSWCAVDFATYSSNPLWFAHNLYLNDKLLIELVVPEGVTAINSKAFINCESITSVIFSPCINYIGEDAFEYCTSLEKVYINDLESWCSIEFANFHSNPLEYAHNLYLNNMLISELVLPDTITFIGAEAFSGCNITSVSIPNSVTFIGARAFSNCNNLQAVKISDISAWCNIQFTYTGSNPLYYANSLYLNDELITDIIIPYGVTNIGAYSFCGGNFTSIEIPDSVISIGEGAFQNCKNLIGLTIPDSVELLGDSICWNCTSLNEVRIGDGITSVGQWTFRECYRLKNVTFGNSVSFIGDYAFDECGALQDIILPNSVIFIGNNAFSGCNFTNLIIPNSVTNIGAQAFFNCDFLKSVTMGDHVVSIGKDAFGLTSTYRSRLEAVYITDIESWCNIEFESMTSNPLYYAHDLYLNDELLTELNIPDKITAIKNYTFMHCTSLAKIKLSASVTSIGDYAFSACNITSIQIPDNVENISNYAFYDCSKLTSVIVPQNILFIGDTAFERCSGLKILFCGTEEEWKNLSNKPKSYYTIYYLSESEPPLNSYGTDYNGNYWHYDNVGNPIIWIYEN